MLTAEAGGLRWSQLTYTVCGVSIRNVAGGWQVKQASRNLDAAERHDIVQSITAFAVPKRPPRFPTPEDLAALPRRLTYLPRADGSATLLHTAYAGLDASRRPDNTFTHVLFDRAAFAAAQRGDGVRPIELWNAPEWLTPYGADAVDAADFADDRLPSATGVTGRDRAVRMVFDSERFRTLALLVDAVAAAVDGGPGVVLVADSSDMGAVWIGAATTFAPLEFAARLSFCTFVRFAELTHPSMHAVSVVLREDLPEGGTSALGDAGWVVIDSAAEGDPEVVRSPSGARVWHDDLGREVPETAWSDMVLAVGGLGAEAAVEALDRMDELALDRPDLTADHPAWPLARVVLENDRLRIDKDLLARARKTLEAAEASLPAPPVAPTATSVSTSSAPLPAPAPSSRTEAGMATTPRSGRPVHATEDTAIDLVHRARTGPSGKPAAAGGEPSVHPRTMSAPAWSGRRAAEAWEDVERAISESLAPALLIPAWESYVIAAMHDRGWLADGAPPPVHPGVGKLTPPTVERSTVVTQVLWDCYRSDELAVAASSEERSAVDVWRIRLLDFLVRAGVVAPAAPGLLALARAVASAAVIGLYSDDPSDVIPKVGELSAVTARLVLRPAVTMYADAFTMGRPEARGVPTLVDLWLKRAENSAEAPDFPALAAEPPAAPLTLEPVRLERHDPPEAVEDRVRAVAALLSDDEWLPGAPPTERVTRAVEEVAPVSSYAAAEIVELVHSFRGRPDLDFWELGTAVLRRGATDDEAVPLAQALLDADRDRYELDAGPPKLARAFVQLQSRPTAELLRPKPDVASTFALGEMAWPDETQRHAVAMRLGLLCLGAAITLGHEPKTSRWEAGPGYVDRDGILRVAGRQVASLQSVWAPHFQARRDALELLALGCGHAICGSDDVRSSDSPVGALLRIDNDVPLIGDRRPRDAASFVFMTMRPSAAAIEAWREAVRRHHHRRRGKAHALSDWWDAIHDGITAARTTEAGPDDPEGTFLTW